MEKGLILNTSYNDFILGTHVSDYFDKRHEEGVASDSPYSDTVSFDFYDDGVDIWCENNIIESICCTKTCIYEGVNLIGMKFDDFLNRFHFSPNPNDEDIIWLEGGDGEKDTNNKTAKTALRNAKEQNKVAKSVQPDSTRYTPEKGTGKRLRTDYYTNSDGKPIGIRKDNPRKYNDGGEQGSHYNAGPLKKKNQKYDGNT